MTCIVTSLNIPSQAVVVSAVVGLLVLLVAGQLTDYEGSSLKLASRYFMAFSIPFFVWFIFNMIIQIARIVIS
jgi:hypothetical protein